MCPLTQCPWRFEASSGLHLSPGFAGAEGKLSRTIGTPGPRTVLGNPTQNLLLVQSEQLPPKQRGLSQSSGKPSPNPDSSALVSSLGATCLLGNEEKPLVGKFYLRCEFRVLCGIQNHCGKPAPGCRQASRLPSLLTLLTSSPLREKRLWLPVSFNAPALWAQITCYFTEIKRPRSISLHQS